MSLIELNCLAMPWLRRNQMLRGSFMDGVWCDGMRDGRDSAGMPSRSLKHMRAGLLKAEPDPTLNYTTLHSACCGLPACAFLLPSAELLPISRGCGGAGGRWTVTFNNIPCCSGRRTLGYHLIARFGGTAFVVGFVAAQRDACYVLCLVLYLHYISVIRRGAASMLPGETCGWRTPRTLLAGSHNTCRKRCLRYCRCLPPPSKIAYLRAGSPCLPTHASPSPSQHGHFRGGRDGRADAFCGGLRAPFCWRGSGATWLPPLLPIHSAKRRRETCPTFCCYLYNTVLCNAFGACGWLPYL